ncbi:MAG: hypothetical protein KC421_04070, partial [Anaerolineales bacterium]|nr:hypothetical protein [Anaerolineales bacterium]
DLDLFRSFLYQPEEAWGQTQVNLVRRDLFFNRAPLSIWLDVENAAAPITAEEVTAEFSADLTRVALMVKRPYLTQNEAGEYEAVQMRQTAVYVRKDGTWLLTELDDAFWGDDLTAESAILTITHPARDAEVAQRLVADLNDLLIDACAADIFICPDDLAISLQFMHQADALPALNRAFELTSRYSTKNGRTYRLFLPTPTLVGLPV